MGGLGDVSLRDAGHRISLLNVIFSHMASVGPYIFGGMRYSAVKRVCEFGAGTEQETPGLALANAPMRVCAEHRIQCEA